MARTAPHHSPLDLHRLSPGHPLLHPINMGFETPMVRAMRDELIHWIYHGMPGGFVRGHSRTGKTKGISLVAPTLRTRQGRPIPFRKVYIGARGTSTVRFVWRSMCQSQQISTRKTSTADDYKEQYTMSVLEQMQANGDNTMLLFVDEVQRLNAEQLNPFAELYDLMANEGIQVITILVGNSDECNKLFRDLNQKEFNHVRGRFGARFHEFSGIRNHGACKECLSAYDKNRFPTSSSPTFTEFCVSGAYRKGWRLASISQEVWSVYSTMLRVGTHVPAWPMAHFVAAMNMLLLDYLSVYGVDNPSEVSTFITESIDSSGVLEFLTNAENSSGD